MLNAHEMFDKFQFIVTMVLLLTQQRSFKNQLKAYRAVFLCFFNSILK